VSTICAHYLIVFLYLLIAKLIFFINDLLSAWFIIFCNFSIILQFLVKIVPIKFLVEADFASSSSKLKSLLFEES